MAILYAYSRLPQSILNENRAYINQIIPKGS